VSQSEHDKISLSSTFIARQYLVNRRLNLSGRDSRETEGLIKGTMPVASKTFEAVGKPDLPRRPPPRPTLAVMASANQYDTCLVERGCEMGSRRLGCENDSGSRHQVEEFAEARRRHHLHFQLLPRKTICELLQCLSLL